MARQTSSTGNRDATHRSEAVQPKARRSELVGLQPREHFRADRRLLRRDERGLAGPFQAGELREPFVLCSGQHFRKMLGKLLPDPVQITAPGRVARAVLKRELAKIVVADATSDHRIGALERSLEHRPCVVFVDAHPPGRVESATRDFAAERVRIAAQRRGEAGLQLRQ